MGTNDGSRAPRPVGRAAERVLDQPAFVLHAQPWRETSLIVELFTRDHGRIGCIAKGAKRPGSTLRGVLHSFQPLQVSFTGRHELRTLSAAHWLGGLASPQGDALLCAFYLNELLVRLIARDDPHPRLFQAYSHALAALGLGHPLEATLRRFEWRLLQESGYGPALVHDVDDLPVQPQRRYGVLPGRGLIAADSMSMAEEGTAFLGQSLLDMAEERYDDARTLADAKRLTRLLLARLLEGQELRTRQILLDLHRL
jgi:DNA repair protein RecO (recombination protein O)